MKKNGLRGCLRLVSILLDADKDTPMIKKKEKTKEKKQKIKLWFGEEWFAWVLKTGLPGSSLVKYGPTLGGAVSSQNDDDHHRNWDDNDDW